MDQQPPMKLENKHWDYSHKEDSQAQRSPGEARADCDESGGHASEFHTPAGLPERIHIFVGFTFKSPRSSVSVREKSLHNHDSRIKNRATLECSGVLCIPLHRRPKERETTVGVGWRRSRQDLELRTEEQHRSAKLNYRSVNPRTHTSYGRIVPAPASCPLTPDVLRWARALTHKWTQK